MKTSFTMTKLLCMNYQVFMTHVLLLSLSHRNYLVRMYYLIMQMSIWEGFENVDPAVMDEQNIFYSISRHAAPESKCQLRDKCTPYGGSHDAFLFRLHRPLPEAFFQDLKFPFCASGMENVLNWLFESQLQMCVLNPCRSLYIYHYHCSKLRMSKPRQRVNNRPEFRNRGIPPPTKKLVCQKVAAQMD